MLGHQAPRLMEQARRCAGDQIVCIRSSDRVQTSGCSDELLESIPALVVVEGGGDGVAVLVLLHLLLQAAPLAPAGGGGSEGQGPKEGGDRGAMVNILQ